MVGGKFNSIIRGTFTLGAIALGAMLFQNCSEEGSGRSTALYQGVGLGSTDCLSETVDCGASSDYLQVTLDMTDNEVVQTSSMLISGRCNSGNFPSYELQWQILDGNGTVKKSGTNSSACITGKYQFTVSVAGLSNNVNYTFTIAMIGLDAGGTPYQNFANNGVAQIDFSRQ